MLKFSNLWIPITTSVQDVLPQQKLRLCFNGLLIDRIVMIAFLCQYDVVSLKIYKTTVKSDGNVSILLSSANFLIAMNYV